MIFGKHINRYYLRYGPVLLLGVMALLVVDYMQLKVPEFYSIMVDGLNGKVENFTMEYLLDGICLPLIIVILTLVVGRFLWRICFFGSAIRMEADLRGRMFDHCKDLSCQYYQVNKVGTMMALFTNDLETIQECFGDGVLMTCDAVMMGALSIIKMWRMNPLLTGFSLIPMALLLAVSTVVGKYMMSKWEKRQEAYSNLSDFAQESFSGIAVIKAFVKESKELWAFKALNKANEKANVTYVKVSTIFHILVTLFVESVICVILGYGGYLVHEGTFTAGRLVEFIGYFGSIVWPIMAVSQLIDMISRGRASLKRVGELLDAPQDVRDRADVKEPSEPLHGGLEVRNLTFRYPDGEYDVLQNVSFRLEPGQSLGIVGKTGCGKTSLVDLLLRTYNVPDGSIFFDGNDVNEIPIRTVREACAYVPQDNFLFSDTIARNIAFGMEETEENREKAKHSAILSDVDGDISGFAKGYDTVLGERGVTVSGGQKQRISIARAIMKDAPILILDDSVSAVDTATERTILEGLRTERKDRTTILIAHRVSTVESLDRILLLDDGRVVDFGSHEELLDRCEEYRKMVELQKLEEEVSK